VYDDSNPIYNEIALDFDTRRRKSGNGEKACADRRIMLVHLNSAIEKQQATLENNRQLLFKLMFKRDYIKKQIDQDWDSMKQWKKAKAKKINLEANVVIADQQLKQHNAAARQHQQEYKVQQFTQIQERARQFDDEQQEEGEPEDGIDIQHSDNEDDDDDNEGDDVDANGNISGLIANSSIN